MSKYSKKNDINIYLITIEKTKTVTVKLVLQHSLQNKTHDRFLVITVGVGFSSSSSSDSFSDWQKNEIPTTTQLLP
jgi:hypothetical protein